MPALTVKELIEVLKDYPEDLHVYAWWEDLSIAVTKDHINIRYNEYSENTLEIYVDQC